MEKPFDGPIYHQEDIEKAFDMGLETAIAVLESTSELSPAKQHMILNKLREDRIKIRIHLGISK